MENAAQKDFFDVINRPDLKTIITPKNPWTYFSLEIGLSELSYAGGLGILAGDIVLQAQKNGVPLVGLTLLYPLRMHQKSEGFLPMEVFEEINPHSLMFKKVDDVTIYANDDSVNLDIYLKEFGSAKVIALYEPGLQELYSRERNSDHRLYQEVVLGFGGYKALKKLALNPSVIHINESPTVFSAIAYLDDLVSQGLTLGQAIDKTKKITLFTNHTLMQSAVAQFSRGQFENYVFKNIGSDEIKRWIGSLIDQQGGNLNLSSLTFEICDHYNGVSRLHSELATHEFKKTDGTPVTFYPITNGIFNPRWADENLYNLYLKNGAINKFGLCEDDYKEKIKNISNDEIMHIKINTQDVLINFLKTKKNQYDHLVDIPQGAKIAIWARRFADYKRPTMIFDNQERLAEILEKENMYLVMSGSIHSGHIYMRQKVPGILNMIASNEILRERIHFIYEYNEEVAKHMVRGCDIWLNTPEVGKEACGTSWMKAVVNCAMLVSSEDGGVADEKPASYLKIEGKNYEEELNSLYQNLEKAGELIDNRHEWANLVKNQLISYLPFVTGARCLREYLEFVYLAN